jgi:hypothetical protein
LQVAVSAASSMVSLYVVFVSVADDLRDSAPDPIEA